MAPIAEETLIRAGRLKRVGLSRSEGPSRTRRAMTTARIERIGVKAWTCSAPSTFQRPRFRINLWQARSAGHCGLGVMRSLRRGTRPTALGHSQSLAIDLQSLGVPRSEIATALAVVRNDADVADAGV
jgi:hypothetical protein